MKFLIVTHAPTLKKDNNYYAYAPYVREMNIWIKHVTSYAILSPSFENDNFLSLKLEKDPILYPVKSIQFKSIKNAIRSLFLLPEIFYKIYKAMKWADHIHLRCPGNIGLLGCIVQIFFPNKIKTAKYAGNWDPKSKQPLSYRIQKWILSNTFLTKNITVLVYGDWPKQSSNIKSFFTATFRKNEIKAFQAKHYNKKLKFLFVGSLVKGKNPMLTVKIIQKLHNQGHDVSLEVYGDGILKNEIQEYLTNNNLNEIVSLHGNQEKRVIEKALFESHFLILLSKSEGWPKAIAEAMFFGVIPIATPISCVPYMLDYGKRGVLVKPDEAQAVNEIKKVISANNLKEISEKALDWSQHYTLDRFESEITLLLNHK